jgi:hypothetical protein
MCSPMDGFTFPHPLRIYTGNSGMRRSRSTDFTDRSLLKP